MRALVVINPIAGRGRSRDPGASGALAREVLGRHGYAADVVMTTAPGDAHAAAARARDEGADLVVAWGGDGTVNEVGSALAFSSTTLAIVPAGSGNGLARDLGLPLNPAGALDIAGGGRAFCIDAGELHGALFFNVAGVGLDAAIAARLASPDVRRGLTGYVLATWLAWGSHVPRRYTIECGSTSHAITAWLVTMANSRQYGNGALIAPQARLDDGRLDIVAVEAAPRWRVALRLPSLFRGTLADGRGVLMRQAAEALIASDGDLPFHVDGEPRLGPSRLALRTRPGALRVKVA